MKDGAGTEMADHSWKDSENLRKLAEELAYNYFSNSFGNDYNLDIADAKKIIREDKAEDFGYRIRKERVRNVLVIGAGASIDTYKAIPAGFGLLEEMKEIFEKPLRTIPFLEQKFLEQVAEIKDITDKSNEDELNFENYLYLLSKFFVPQQELREKIRDMTGYRYSVSLFNEVVAHLLKHSFLDIVINFNFEETLDLSIQQEIGSNNYHNIISDGNVVGMHDLLVDGRLKIPIYIKPHGTYSHKSTLRFTNRHYFDLPNDIKKMLADLLRGSSGAKEIERVNLIIVGHAMQSIEFNKVLDEHLPKKSRIYNIDWVPETGDKFFRAVHLNNFLERAATVNLSPSEIYRPISTKEFAQNDEKLAKEQIEAHQVIGNRITPTFGELFSILWRIQSEFFQKSFKPRSIARHEITSYLFYLPKLGLTSLREKGDSLNQRLIDRRFIMDKIETHPKYFRNRVLVELFITLNRNNGVLDIAEVLKGRAGDFYNRYAETVAARPTTIRGLSSVFELLEQFMCKESREKVKDDRKVLPAIAEYSSGKNIFLLQSEFLANELTDREKFESKIEELATKIGDHFQGIPVPMNDVPSGSFGKGESLQQVADNFRADFIAIQKNIYNKWTEVKPRDLDSRLLKLGRSITLFYRLMTSDLLSNFFKFNFLYNYKREIFNGKDISGRMWHGERNIMLGELFRLLTKSWNYNYFIIDQNPANPVHRMFESFSKRKLIHTNLGRTAEFNHLFSEKDWDIYLTVTETGSLLNFLHDMADDTTTRYEVKQKLQEKLEKKHFIFICSYETIRQLYPEQESVEKLLEKHRDYLRIPIKEEGKEDEYLIRNLSLLAVPFNHHNHHLSVFLKKYDLDQLYHNLGLKNTLLRSSHTAKDGGRYLFEAVGSLYLYRSGFSNSVDPMYVGAAAKEVGSDGLYRDQFKLIDTFVEHLTRAFKFEKFSRPNTAVWAKAGFLKKLQADWEENYDKIDTDGFLGELYVAEG